MDFNIAEKLAIVMAIDSIIVADGLIHNGEIDHLSKLMGRIDFDSNFIVYARNITPEQGMKILKGMSHEKKIALAGILEEVANSDGFVHKKETALIVRITAAMGIGAKMTQLKNT